MNIGKLRLAATSPISAHTVIVNGAPHERDLRHARCGPRDRVSRTHGPGAPLYEGRRSRGGGPDHDGRARPPAPLQWLSDNGSMYPALDRAQDIASDKSASVSRKREHYTRRASTYADQSSPGIMRRMNASNSGTVNAVSP
jgi:hypothetical protein